MVDSLYRLGDYLFYLATAGTKHSVHSPFMYDFVTRILLGKEESSLFGHIETIRKKMVKSDTQIPYQDFGGGNKTGNRKLAELVGKTGRQAKYGRFLYRLLRAYQPVYNLELGTGTGMTTMYMAAALDEFRPLHTVEANAGLLEIVNYNLEQMQIKERVHTYAHTFENALPELLRNLPRIDFAYIDGNHRFEPTVRYFEQIVEKSHPGTILVFDDINWSEEMKQSWHYIKNQEKVTSTLDIFNFGIVFFRLENKEKEHFTIRY